MTNLKKILKDTQYPQFGLKWTKDKPPYPPWKHVASTCCSHCLSSHSLLIHCIPDSVHSILLKQPLQMSLMLFVAKANDHSSVLILAFLSVAPNSADHSCFLETLPLPFVTPPKFLVSLSQFPSWTYFLYSLLKCQCFIFRPFLLLFHNEWFLI